MFSSRPIRCGSPVNNFLSPRANSIPEPPDSYCWKKVRNSFRNNSHVLCNRSKVYFLCLWWFVMIGIIYNAAICSARMIGAITGLQLAQRMCNDPLQSCNLLSENVWSNYNSVICSTKLFGAISNLRWLQTNCLEKN